ncbi:MAG TPA: hypothetical protein VIF14_17835 [Alphaproteobacteria bacterium]|jgi:hypothetical protein
MLPGYTVVDDFFPEAEALRAAIDAHFAEPAKHRPETHQVWNYWHVPGLYTYLRTSPEKVLPRALLDRFLARLRAMALYRFGLGDVTWPYLSLYVAGCQQGLHNDAKNGRFGYVYSLTRWDGRKFEGGETLIFKEQDYIGTAAITRPNAGIGLYELVPARFNRLLLFDDRMLHAVPRLEGTMVPQDGRIVLHGHVSEGAVAVTGALAPAAVAAILEREAAALKSRADEAGNGLAGLVAVRLTVGEDGRVLKDEILFDRLLPVARPAADAAAAAAAIREFLSKLIFPAAGGASLVTVPVAFGAKLR